MVTTRLQEAQQQMDTPPAGRLQRRGEEPSPSTPADAALPIARPPLKSALKTQGGRTRRQSNGWSDDTATPADAGVKKTVRIHSSNNMVHEFQTSHTTEEQLCGSDDDGAETPNSRPRRYGQMRGTALPHYSQFMSTVRHDMTASRDRRRSGGVGGRGRRRQAPESTAMWLGLLFTLSWMLASSALIFLNKTLMVDLGFRFPFALTSMGQVSSMLLGEWAASNPSYSALLKAVESSPAVQRFQLLWSTALSGVHFSVLALQPGWRREQAWRHCERHPPGMPCSPSCCLCRSALRPRCSWAMLHIWGCLVSWRRFVSNTSVVNLAVRPTGKPVQRPTRKLLKLAVAPFATAAAVAFINIMKAATPMVTLAVGLALGLEQPSKLTLCGTALIAGGTAIATCSEAASGGLPGDGMAQAGRH
jgi:hypothetical protein